MKPKYKIGDRVKIVRQEYGHQFPEGAIVTITSNPCEDVGDSGSYNYYAQDSRDSDDGWYVWEEEIEPAGDNPLDVQVGGNHYKEMKIQPVEFILANNLNFCEGNVIKYVCRHKSKNGVEDLKKARHYLDLLISSMEED